MRIILILCIASTSFCALQVKTTENKINSPQKCLIDEQSKIHRFIQINKEKLLPAIIGYNQIEWHGQAVEGTAEAMAEVNFRANLILKQLYKNHVDRMDQEKSGRQSSKNSRTTFILSIIGLNEIGQKVYHDNCFNMDKMDAGHPRFPRFIQHAEGLLKRLIVCNEHFYLLWSNGSIKIKIHQEDENKLYRCTSEQLQLIQALYGNFGKVTLSNRGLVIFDSLTKSMRRVLKHNYPSLRLSFAMKKLALG